MKPVGDTDRTATTGTPLGITQVEAADKMGILLNRLTELTRGKRGVTADTALRPAKLVKTSPEFWMNLQAA